MGHLVLVGDSVFDNAAYTRGAPDVVAHLRDLLGAEWKVTRVAIDGANTETVHAQIRAIPADATAVVLSVGGNDVLDQLDLLVTPARHAGQVLDLFGTVVDGFGASYEAVLAALPAQVRRIACTIYDGRLDPRDAGRARVALMLFDDTIVRAARARGVDVIELRAVCTEAQDYASPLEPSGSGGRKIALAVARALAGGGSRISA